MVAVLCRVERADAPARHRPVDDARRVRTGDDFHLPRRKPQELKTERIAQPSAGASAGRTHDRPGETFQKLSADVAYLKLSSVQAAQAVSYIQSAAGTKGLIIDIRNYPSEFVVFALGSHFIQRSTAFARFTVGRAGEPGRVSLAGPTTDTRARRPALHGENRHSDRRDLAEPG